MPGFAGVSYSGYQAGMAYQFRDAISQNLEHFQMAYLFEYVLCSHAGISPEWLERSFGKPNDETEHNWNIDTLDGIKHVVDLINDHFKYKPTIFEFNGWNSYGDNTYQTPIWIRPASLMKSNQNSGLKKNVIQVVVCLSPLHWCPRPWNENHIPVVGNPLCNSVSCLKNLIT
jgi:hypothetical protein